jgi:AraC-like DNA-binding protein
MTAQNNQAQIDSLRNVVVTQHGIEKVDTYRVIGSYLFENASLEEMAAYFDELEAITLQEEKNDKDSKNAHLYIIAYANAKLNYGYTLFNFSEFEEVEKQARAGMNYCRENNEREIYYKHYDLLLDALSANQKYDILQQEAKNLYNEAKTDNEPFGMVVATFAIANVYLYQYRFSEAENYFKQCIDLAHNADFEAVCYVLVQSYRSLTMALMMQQKYDETLQTLQKAETVVQQLEELEAGLGRASQTERFYLYCHYVEYYLRIKEYDKAEEYFNRVEKIVQSFDDESMYDERYFLVCAYIFEIRGRYAEAYEAVEMVTMLMHEALIVPMNYCEVLNLKARLLIHLGRGEESIALYDSILIMINQIRDIEFNAQFDELRTVYEVDKHIAEKERHRNYFLFALGGCLLLAIALGIWIYYSRTIVRKNRDLYRKIKEQDRLAEELEAMVKQYDQMALPVGANNYSPLPGNKQQRQLVSRLREFLLNDRYFANYDLDIQEIIPEMATNRTSLFEAIKAVTGKTPMEFINDLRLDEAKQLLDNSVLTIETIAYECGFNTSRTLYRQFRERYHITPAEYRKVAKG